MVFVTGGTGLIGSHLLLQLVLDGQPVKALRRKSSNLEQVSRVFSFYSAEAGKLMDKIEWVEGDVLDIFSLGPLLQGVDTVYHCAAIVSFDPKQRKSMISNNVEGTANLVNAALDQGVKRFCHVSSVSALGRASNGQAISETCNWVPSKRSTGYAESKFFSEAEIWRGVEEGIEAVVVNPSIVIGPGNWGQGSTAFFPAVFKGMKFYTTGMTGFVDVRDVVAAMLMLMRPENFEKAKNQRFLLSGANISYQELLGQVADALRKPRPAIGVTSSMMGVAWRLSALWSLLTGKPPLITRETAASANTLTRYDGSKISQTFQFKYRQIGEAISHTATCFLADRETLS